VHGKRKSGKESRDFTDRAIYNFQPGFSELYFVAPAMRSRLLKLSLCCTFLIICGFSARALQGYWLLYSATIQSNRLYGSYRPFLYRWSGALYGRARATNACTPVPQQAIDGLELKRLRAERILGQSSRTFQLLGREALLGCQAEDSINQYKQAIQRDANNPDLQLELGIANAIRANPDRALDYEDALEHILRADTKRSPEFLFDSALLFQEMRLQIQAGERWAEADLKESAPLWKKETNQEATAARDFLQARKQRISKLSSPVWFVASTEREKQQGEELALESAITDWLPQLDRSAEAFRATQELSRMLLRDHQDRWLVDLLRARNSQENSQGLILLAQSLQSNFNGEHIHAAASARDSQEDFKKSGNMAGVLRAQLEEVYALDRQDRPEDCLTALTGLEETAHAKSYIWVEAQARLERITCQTRSHRWDVLGTRRTAYEWIRGTGYQGLTLRSLGFMNEPYVAGNSRSMIWSRGMEGLKIFWDNSLPILRVYSLYYTLANSAQKAGNIQASLTLLREGTLLLQGSGLNLIRGILLSSLGQWEIQAKDARANGTFDEMAMAFKQVEPAEINKVWSEAEAAHAEALVATDRAEDGLMLLEQRTQGTPWPYTKLNNNLRRALFPAFGNAYLRTGDLESACKNFLQSVTEARENMADIQNHPRRNNALQEMDASWRGLAAVKLLQNRPAEALAVWEIFRSERNPQKAAFDFPDCGPSASRPDFSLPKDTTALVYAFLPTGLSGSPKGLSAWIVSRGKTEQLWLNGDGIQNLAERLSALVSDSNSRLEDISTLSAELYHRLLAPLSGKLSGSGTLVIDADGELSAIPWSVLEYDHSHPLVERFAISQIAGIFHPGLEETPAGLDHALIFEPPAIRGDLASRFPPLPDAAEEVARVHRLLPSARFIPKDDANFETLRAYAPQASLFHFPGHAVGSGGYAALLLPNSRSSAPDTQYVTADQIIALDLGRMRTVVLASCSSGTGERNGTVNLDSVTRAFLEAGAGRVIAAGWDVSSGRTADLMTFFYKQLTDRKHPPAEALRQAQLKLRLEAPHPYYWAAFQVFGEP
jgi:CHAT domain-containing protein